MTYTNEQEANVTIQGKTVLVATGCYERPPGAITIEGPRIAGIYTAGQAQKYLNMDGYLVGKKVAVLGSGDIGLIMARRMYLEGAEVVGVFEILPYSNGLARNIHQCLGDYSIPLYVSHTVTRVFGRKRLEKIEVMKVDQDRRPLPATEKYFDVDTLLLSVGLLPETSLLEQAGARLHPDTKGAIVDEYYQTSVPGLFASGNGLHVHDLVDYVTLQSRRAAEGMAACLKKEIPSVLHEVYAEGNVSYTIPCCIHEKPVKETEFFFRARQPMQKGVLHIYDEEKEIRQMRKQKWVPSEMERVLLTEEQLLSVKGNLHFSLREE